MKRAFALLTFALLGAFFALHPQVSSAEEAAQPTAEKAEKIEVTIVGEVVDTVCYLDHGAKGADHKACAVSCAESGLPVAILEDDTEFLYVAITPDHKPANGMLIPFMAQRVEVKGNLIEGNGLTLIEVKEIKPAA